MNHYLEIQVLPDPEFAENLLMNALFAKLHRALADVGRGEVGVSFPHADKTLGDCLRLHGARLALDRLMAEDWLKGLRDYTKTSVVQAVPDSVQYRVVKRVQVKSSVDRLRRRSVKKGWMTEEQAIEDIPLTNEKQTKLPFLQLKSISTGQAFRLFIQQDLAQTDAVSGKFSDYGLSSSATIPYF